MPEMNAISRFFVNVSAARRSRRSLAWVRGAVRVPPAATCLEVGCGNGDFARRFIEAYRPARYVATDIDPLQIAAADASVRRRSAAGPPTSLELRTADVLGLPFGDATFDLVFAFLSIHHASPTHHDFSRVPQALGEIDRTLRPDGRLVYQEFLHREPIRRWLTDRGYALERVDRRWRIEAVVARKAARPPAAVDATP
jgi:ubiquinone/menaquinone biosynthesis C-methylase UbiE